MAGDLIFVTGGTGFLGRHLVRTLLGQGHRLRLFVRKTSDISWLPKQGVELVWGDVNSQKSLLEGIQGCRYVVHAAGFFRFWGPFETFDRVNLHGTRLVAEAALLAKVERMIYVSTLAVVGRPEKNQIIDEEARCRPQDPYQHSKLSAENMLLEMTASQELPALILRPGAYYGPGSHYGFNRLFIIEPMHGWRVKVEGGRRLTFPVYVPDVAQSILQALSLGRVGQVYNISDQSPSHNQVNQIVSELLGISSWRLSVPRIPMLGLAAVQEGLAKLSRREPFYPLNLRHYVFNDWNVSSEKAAGELGFAPTPLEVGLKSTVQWLKSGK